MSQDNRDSRTVEIHGESGGVLCGDTDLCNRNERMLP
jgi:hypothetical protein